MLCPFLVIPFTSTLGSERFWSPPDPSQVRQQRECPSGDIMFWLRPIQLDLYPCRYFPKSYIKTYGPTAYSSRVDTSRQWENCLPHTISLLYCNMTKYCSIANPLKKGGGESILQKRYAFPIHEYIIPRRSQTFGASAGPTSEDWFEHFSFIFMQWCRQWYSDICIPTASTPLPQKSACVPWCQAHSLQSWPQRRLSEMVKNEGQEIWRYSMGNWKNNLKHLCTCDNLYGIMNNCCRKTVEHMWSLFYTNYFNTK